jgi:hypothetical protein
MPDPLRSPGADALDLTPIQAREAAATKGPWYWGWHDKSLQSLSGPCEINRPCCCPCRHASPVR